MRIQLVVPYSHKEHRNNCSNYFGHVSFASFLLITSQNPFYQYLDLSKLSYTSHNSFESSKPFPHKVFRCRRAAKLSCSPPSQTINATTKYVIFGANPLVKAINNGGTSTLANEQTERIPLIDNDPSDTVQDLINKTEDHKEEEATSAEVIEEGPEANAISSGMWELPPRNIATKLYNNSIMKR
jgi:hypothetical protein